MYANQGTVIFREGDSGRSFFWIRSGEVSVYRNYGNADEMCLGVFTDNCYFGEMAIIDGEPRSATAVATKDTEFIQILIDDIGKIIKTHPPAVESFIKILSRRVRELNNSYAEACKTIVNLTAQLEERSKN